MPGYGSGAVVLPWSSPRGQHHAAVARKVHLTNLFSFPEPPLIDITGGNFDRSWMIEPDKFNVATIRSFLRRFVGTKFEHKISVHDVAVSDFKGVMPFNHLGWHNGSLSNNGGGNGDVRVDTIDNIIDDVPTIIKMDIEGAEMSAIKGASHSIKKGRPKIFASAYHRFDDLLNIPSAIEELRDDYKIGLRHHTDDRWDTCLYFY